MEIKKLAEAVAKIRTSHRAPHFEIVEALARIVEAIEDLAGTGPAKMDTIQVSKIKEDVKVAAEAKPAEPEKPKTTGIDAVRAAIKSKQ